MKKNLILALCIPALLLAGCTSTLKEPEVEVPSEPQETRILITARMQNAPTRVSYFEEQQEIDGKTQRILHQQWNVGDFVYAFYLTDSGKEWVVLQVDSILEDGEERVAQLTCVDGKFPTSGRLYALYCGQGSEANPDACDSYAFYYGDRISFNQIDYGVADIYYNADAPEDLNVPAIMSADAEITSKKENGVLTVGADLSFNNQTAIIGVGGIQVDPGVEIDRIKLSGIRASAAFEIDPSTGALIFDFDGDVNQAISVDLQNNDGRPLCADGQGFIRFEGTNRGPLFMAVFPSLKGEEEEILLQARVAWGDEMNQNYYTLSLGKRDIIAGKYYYIPTRTLSAPPAVCVSDQENNNKEFSSLAAAFHYVNEQSTGDVVIKLLRDITATSLPALSGNEEGQWVQFNLNEKTLTLEGCSLEVEDEVSFWISGYDETIYQPGDGIGVIASAGGDPFLECSAGFVLLNNVIVRYDETNQGAPIQISGGEVDIQGGRYSWDSGVLVSTSSAGSCSITGGRFSMDPGVALGSGMELGWDDDPLRQEYEYEEDGVDDPYCPYICLPSSLIDNVAHTVDGSLRKLAVFSVDDLRYERMYLARNNLYRNGNQWAFESPNWTAAGQDSHENLFSYDELDSELDFFDDWRATTRPVSVNEVTFEWMDSNQWGALLNGRCVEVDGGYTGMPRYLKCKVQDSKGVLWRNLLVFPDEFEWPQMVGNCPENLVNIHNLPWDNNEDPTSCAPILTQTQANALIAAGFVFLPAAIPTEDPVTGYSGGYWSSSEGFSYVFTDSNVGYQSEPNNSELSFRVAYPCNR